MGIVRLQPAQITEIDVELIENLVAEIVLPHFSSSSTFCLGRGGRGARGARGWDGGFGGLSSFGLRASSSRPFGFAHFAFGTAGVRDAGEISIAAGGGTSVYRGAGASWASPPESGLNQATIARHHLPIQVIAPAPRRRGPAARLAARSQVSC